MWRYIDNTLSSRRNLFVIGGLYLFALAVFFAQTIWYYSASPLLYAVYLLLHFGLFVAGAIVVTSMRTVGAFGLAFLVALVMGHIPLEFRVPLNFGLIFDLESNAADLSALLKNSDPRLRALVDVLFFPVIYCLLFVGAYFLTRQRSSE